MFEDYHISYTKTLAIRDADALMPQARRRIEWASQIPNSWSFKTFEFFFLCAFFTAIPIIPVGIKALWNTTAISFLAELTTIDLSAIITFIPTFKQVWAVSFFALALLAAISYLIHFLAFRPAPVEIPEPKLLSVLACLSAMELDGYLTTNEASQLLTAQDITDRLRRLWRRLYIQGGILFIAGTNQPKDVDLPNSHSLPVAQLARVLRFSSLPWIQLTGEAQDTVESLSSIEPKLLRQIHFGIVTRKHVEALLIFCNILYMFRLGFSRQQVDRKCIDLINELRRVLDTIEVFEPVLSRQRRLLERMRLWARSAIDHTVYSDFFPTKFFTVLTLTGVPIFLGCRLLAQTVFNVNLQEKGMELFGAALLANVTVASIISANLKRTPLHVSGTEEKQ